MNIGSKVYHYEEIDSTNLEAKRLSEQGAENGSVIVADRQTEGRGRRGRIWESSNDGNLYFSLLLKPDFEVQKSSMLTLVMALAALKACEKVSDTKLQIKWPNDIVAGGKKLVGILTELNLLPEGGYQVIVGVGINVVKQDFPEAIAEIAVSLEEASGKVIAKEDLLKEILAGFEELYLQFCKDGNLGAMVEEYNGKLVNNNQEVKVLEPTGEYTGHALGINEEGELLVAPIKENGEADMENVRKIYAGEVSVRGIYGYV